MLQLEDAGQWRELQPSQTQSCKELDSPEIHIIQFVKKDRNMKGFFNTS